MRNKFFLIVIILPAILGCGLVDRARKAASETTQSNSNAATLPVNVNSNKSVTETAIDAAVGEKKIGIAECDEALQMLTAQAEDPEDSFVTKAVKKTALNTFRDHVKKSLDENKTDRKELAKFCREFRDNVVDSKTAENSNAVK
jgi:hypothetical protein